MLNAKATPRQAAPRGPRAAAVWALGVVLMGTALRLWRLQHGLPDFLEEAIPFKRALEMWGWDTGRTDLNPHFFHYPSLAIYVHFLGQKLHYLAGHLLGTYGNPNDYWLAFQIDPTPHVTVARLIGIACDAATILGVRALAERLRPGAGLPAALLLALSPTLIETGRSIFTDSLMAALAAWALERMLAWREEGGRGRLAAAVILCGLAAGAKYTAGFLVLPLGWSLWSRLGRRGLALWPAAAAGAVLAFLASSPYVLLDLATFRADFAYEARHMAEGHLGTLGRRAALFQLGRVRAEWGWGAAALLVASLGFLLGARRPWRERATAVPWLFLLPSLLSVLWFRMEANRYLLPILPPAAALVAAAIGSASLRLAGGRRRALAVGLLAAVLIPAARGGLHTAAAGSDTTQLQARRWLERHVPRQELILQEVYGARLRNSFDLINLRRARPFAAAGEAMRETFLALPWHRSLMLPLATSGRFDMMAHPEGGPPVSLTVFAHASGINQVFYDPALLHGVDWFVTSAAVRGRYEADPDRYPRQIGFYALLNAHAAEAARFRAGGTVTGPEIVVYRLDGDFARFLAGKVPPLEPYWWAGPVPREYRLRLEELLVPPDSRSGGTVQLPNGQPAFWVLSLQDRFESHVLPFLAPLAQYLMERGRFEPARRCAASILGMIPDLPAPALIFSRCSTQMGNWDQARLLVRNTLTRLEGDGRDSAALRLELARLLRQADEPEAAAAQLRRVVASNPPDSQAAIQARRLLESAPPAAAGSGAPRRR